MLATLNNDYKGVVSFELFDGSKTVTECAFATEYLAHNWLLKAMTDIYMHGNHIPPSCVIGEIFYKEDHTVYKIEYNKTRKNTTNDTKMPTNDSDCAKKKVVNRSRNVYMFWNKGTRSILATYSMAIAADLERNGWTKLTSDTPLIGSKYFARCVNWFVARDNGKGNYETVKTDYGHMNNDPDAFKAYVRSIL